MADSNPQPGHVDPARLPWLVQRVVAHPDHCAIRFQDCALSFAGLLQRSERAAEKLSTMGVGEGDVLAMALPNSPLFAELLHACTLLGAVVLPLNIRLSRDELRHCLTDSGAKFCLCENGGLYEGLREIATLTSASVQEDCLQAKRLLVLTVDAFMGLEGREHRLNDNRRSNAKHRQVDPASPLCIMYTSGTTGRPKGVVLSYRNFEGSAQATKQHFSLTADDSWLACMPLFHIGGLSILTRSAIIGLTVVLEPRFDPQQVLSRLPRVSMVSFVPNMLQRVLTAAADDNEGGATLPQLKAIILGGEALPQTLFRQATVRGFPVVASYGLTEACSQIAASAVGESSARLIVFNGVELKIIDHQGRSQATGEAGEILIRGSCVTSTYHNNPLVNKSLLDGGWLYSGDIGRLEVDGRLTVLNRRADLIIRGGENVYPSEVERVLRQYPGVVDVLVFGEHDAQYGQSVVARIVSNTNTSTNNNRVLEVQDIIQFCRTQLAAFKVPARIEFVHRLERSATGKLIRRLR